MGSNTKKNTWKKPDWQVTKLGFATGWVAAMMVMNLNLLGSLSPFKKKLQQTNPRTLGTMKQVGHLVTDD